MFSCASAMRTFTSRSAARGKPSAPAAAESFARLEGEEAAGGPLPGLPHDAVGALVDVGEPLEAVHAAAALEEGVKGEGGGGGRRRDLQQGI